MTGKQTAIIGSVVLGLSLIVYFTDFNKAEKARKERSVSGIDDLVSQFVNKVQAEEPEVQKEIMRMLERKLESVNAVNLFKRISKKIDYTSFTAPKAPEAPEEIYLDDEDEYILK